MIIMENKFQFVSLPTTTMYGGYLTVACDIILCPKYEWDGKKTQQIFIYWQYK